MATLPVSQAQVGQAGEESFASKKGEVQKCPMCNNALLPPPARLHCKWCLSSGYVALCLVCRGTGREVAIAAWDNKSQHGSTCNTCGGLKFIPSRESEFLKWQADHPSEIIKEDEKPSGVEPEQSNPILGIDQGHGPHDLHLPPPTSPVTSKMKEVEMKGKTEGAHPTHNVNG